MIGSYTNLVAGAGLTTNESKKGGWIKYKTVGNFIWPLNSDVGCLNDEYSSFRSMKGLESDSVGVELSRIIFNLFHYIDKKLTFM